MDKFEVKDLNLYYGSFHALKGVSMDIPEKEITAFIGPSGCGKSTFLKTLNRMNDLVEGCRITGDVKLDCVYIYKDKLDVNVLRKRVGMVFQKPNPFPMSIYDNIAYGPRTHGIRNKAQLDEILTSLVTEFDDEELPLRKEEKYHQFVVDFDGDVDRANKHMAIEQTAFEEHKDFTQLLTDAAMKPESAHASVSTQKFAIALSKEWVSNAYNDVVAQNRMKIPHEIEINVDTFNDKTTDGQNEEELIGRFNDLVDQEEASALAQCILSSFEKFCLWGGAVIGIIGLAMLMSGSSFLGLIAVVAGVGLILNHFSKKKKIETNRQNIMNQFEQKRTNGTQVIRALLAEVVDFRAEFAEKDGESQKVIDFLEQISPEQYVMKLSDSSRRINVTK